MCCWNQFTLSLAQLHGNRKTKTSYLHSSIQDFVIDEVQILEAKESGASAVLLIVAVLGEQTPYYVNLCNHIGIECLVEIYTEEELEIALRSSMFSLQGESLGVVADFDFPLTFPA